MHRRRFLNYFLPLVDSHPDCSSPARVWLRITLRVPGWSPIRLGSFGRRQRGQRQPVMSDEEAQQGGEYERERARDDDVNVVLECWIVDLGLL